MREAIIKNPSFHSYWLTVASFFVFPFYEVGIVGEDTFKKKTEISQKYFPDIILFGSRNNGTLEILKDRFVEGKTMIYVCEDQVCKLPVEETDKAFELLNKRR
jgi:uncharacterized protein YyaL (SSP411 family)